MALRDVHNEHLSLYVRTDGRIGERAKQIAAAQKPTRIPTRAASETVGNGRKPETVESVKSLDLPMNADRCRNMLDMRMEPMGIEPTTSALRTQRSPN